MDVLLGKHRLTYEPSQWTHLKIAIAEVFARQEGRPTKSGAKLDEHDRELARDVFWDLFRQGHITLGLDDNNAEWPFFRLSHFGATALTQNAPYRFTDSSSYIEMVKASVGELDELTATYLDEAVQAFYAGCLLASCIMLGVATEHRFNRLCSAIDGDSTHGSMFRPVAKERTFFAKVTKFKNLLSPVLSSMPPAVREDLDTNLNGILALIRTHRNAAGHPTGTSIGREQVYILLQLFAPLAQKLAMLQAALTGASIPAAGG